MRCGCGAVAVVVFSNEVFLEQIGVANCVLLAFAYFLARLAEMITLKVSMTCM